MSVVTIHQIEHLPWLGLLDKISKAEVCILGDDFQFKKNYFENRNKIRTPDGWQWVTVPIKGSTHIPMKEIEINNETVWRRNYLGAISYNYSNSKYFDLYYPKLKEIINDKYTFLIDLNIKLLYWILESFNIKTKIELASDFGCSELKGTERLLKLCQSINASEYLSGMSGKDYLNLDLFKEANINVKFHEFFHQAYKQNYKGFEYCMSALDLMFNCGPKGCEQALDGKGILSMSGILPSNYSSNAKILEMFGGNGEGHLEAYALDNPNVTIWELDEDNCTQLELEYPKAKVMNVNSLEEINKHTEKYNIIIIDAPAKLNIKPILDNLYKLVDFQATVIIRMIKMSYNDCKEVDLTWIEENTKLPNLVIYNYDLRPREAYCFNPWLYNCVLEVTKI